MPQSRSSNRIGLFGNFGSPNLGNEGTLKAMVDVIRRHRPDAAITCICRAPENVRSMFGLPAVPLITARSGNAFAQRMDRSLRSVPSRGADFLAALSTLRELDVLVVPGTGILDDFGERPSAMPLALYTWGSAARLLRRPIAFVSIGAGPIRDPKSRWLMRASAAFASFRSYRDDSSKRYMAGLGLDTSNDNVTPDLAFALPAPRVTCNGPSDATLTVGLGVMHYHGWAVSRQQGDQIYATYLDRITDFARWLIDHGHRIRLLIGSQSDLPTVEELRRRLHAGIPGLDPMRLVANAARDITGLMEQMVDTDVVVATRFHNVVCALKLAKPTISLGYAGKNDELLARVGLGGYHQSVEAIDTAKLITQFERLVASRHSVSASINRAVVAFERELADQEQRLLTRVL